MEKGPIVPNVRRRTEVRRTSVAAVVWIAALACVPLAGCSTSIVGTPTVATPRAAGQGPILPAQLPDLLTPSSTFAVTPGAPLVEKDMHSVLFAGADPADCLGATGYGTFPLFPSDYTGREARTLVDSVPNQHQLLEVSATYPSDFDAASLLASVRARVARCQRPVVAWADDYKRLTVTPGPLAPPAPNVATWSTNIVGEQWICDFAVIAKANVVAQLVTCSPDRSIDNAALVTARLTKIDELLNSRS